MISERLFDTDWWYWLTITLLLATGLLHWAPALALGHLVCAARSVQLAIVARSLNAFAVQVNVVFLALVVTTNLFAPQALFATALVLAGARVATGYCAIARLLALLPINRQAPLTWAVVKCTLFAKPIPGSVLQQAMNPGDMARA